MASVVDDQRNVGSEQRVSHPVGPCGIVAGHAQRRCDGKPGAMRRAFGVDYLGERHGPTAVEEDSHVITTGQQLGGEVTCSPLCYQSEVESRPFMLVV